MTIVEFYKRGDISNYTRNICSYNKIKTFRDLELHYIEHGTFANLRYCVAKSNNELIDVYNKYREKNDENKKTQPDIIKKSEVKLEDVVTDLDKVVKTTLTTHAYLKKIEQKLENYWNVNIEKAPPKGYATEYSVETSLKTDFTVVLDQVEQKLQDYWNEGREKEVPKSVIIEPSAKISYGVTDVVDLEEIEQAIEDYWNKKTDRDRINADNLDQVEQRLQDYWSECREKEAPRSDIIAPSLKGRSNVTDVVDLEKIEQAIEDYWNKKTGRDRINADNLDQVEQRLRDYWSESREKEASRSDIITPSVKRSSNVTDVVDLEKIEQTIEDYRSEKTDSDRVNVDNLNEIEQKLKDYWKKQASEGNT